MRLETFFEKFELFAGAPDAVAKMRELVLQLAVEGRLVPQDPEDEPVEELLARCLAERCRLKRTDATAVPVIDSVTALGYGIPTSWQWQTLDDLLIFGPTNGFSPKAVDYETPVRSLTLTATTSGKFKGEYSKFIAAEIPPESTLWLCDGDILVQRANTIENVGVSAVYRGKANTFVYPDLMMKLRVSSLLVPEFIHLAMNQRDARNFLRARASGTSGSMPKINQETLRKLPLPIPPFAEQKRIVAKVDELMALCDRLEAQQREKETRHGALTRAALTRFTEEPTPANLNLLFHRSYDITPADLRKSILTLAFQGKLVPRTSPTKFASLGSILAEASMNGVSKGPTSDTTATEILRISAGTSRSDFYVDEKDFKYVDLPAQEIEKFRLTPGDLLACRFNGNLHYVGRFSYYRGESGRIQVNPDKLIRFRVDSKLHCPRYVCYAMNAAPTRKEIEVMCATTAGNIGLSAGRLKTVEIPLPPLAEQRRIVAKVDELMTLVDQLEAQLATARTTATKLLDAVVAELTARA